MSGTKAALKAIGEAIKQQKWDEATKQAEDLLQREPKNYQAHIFLAFALDKKNKLDEAEGTYKAATGFKPSDPQAWQGLIKLCEKQGGKKIKVYQNAALRLAEIFRDAGDMYKCQDTVDKFVDFARANGDREQYVVALGLILPDSPIYAALEGRVPHPARTYESIAQIVEADEKKRINTLIGERRTRIGARLHDVTVEVKREVLGQSNLGYIYRQLIDWSTDDDVRRNYDEKLFQHSYDRLLVFAPGPEKEAERKIVQKLANDTVIIKHPFKLAWDIALDWQDHQTIGDWDITVLREYCLFFPDSDMCRVLNGFLTSDVSPFPKPAAEAKSEATTKARRTSTSKNDDESEDNEEGGVATSYVPVTEEDRLLMMTEGIVSADSLLAYRLMGEYYQHLEEYESNVELMRKAIAHLHGERIKTGLEFRHCEDAFSLYLGTALVFYQSPRHHQEAKALFDAVLEHNPSSTAALIGIGLVYEEEEEYDEAIDFLERAMKRDPGNLRVRAEAAWVKALKGDYAKGKEELEPCLALMVGKGRATKELLAQTQYRLGVCIWNLDTSKAARKNRGGAYALFLDALKNDLNYAPAYTSLGVFYADYAKDKKRARRCFQKAVELSASEVEAAERLARSFADEGDWDRVELVAQRVVDSGKVKPPPGSKRKGISWPFAALGVAELNKQDYTKAIVSFQAALRISSEDYHSWVGLGESYHNSGRYIAATKAVLNAMRLSEGTPAQNNGDIWFAQFMLANIKRELGEFDDAIDLYRAVLASRPNEDGVSIALLQTMVESAFDSVDKGLFGKAVKLATETISSTVTARERLFETFNFWKAVADACSIFSSIQSRVADLPKDLLHTLLGEDDEAAEYQLLKDIDGVGTRIVFAKGIFPDDEKVGVDLTRCIHASILAHKRAIHVSVHDVHAQAVAHYNLGWAEYRAHICLPASLRKNSSRYLKAAVRCFKRAIELEAGNSEFWNALGVVTSQINPSVSQHSFVRSLFLNERSAQVWTNLGTLALLQNDAQLANETFTRAQSTDPDYAHAWLGQAFIALLFGDPTEARGLFTHAFGLSDASSIIAQRQYSVSLFDHLLSAPPDITITSLIQATFALSRLQGLRPQDFAYGHLSTLFQERTGDNARAVETLEKICASLETEYEVSESHEALRGFMLSRADLARSHLATGSYERAIKCGETSLLLSNDQADGGLTPDERRKARLSAHLAVGLAQYFSADVTEAVTCLGSALEESGGDADATCLLAQVLWATGDEDARERARTSLFEMVEASPGHVNVVLLLGVIALLDRDEEALEAVVAELQGLRARGADMAPPERADISEVLLAVAALGEGGGEEAVLAQVQTDVMLYPYLPHGWSSLAEASGEEGPAEMALRVALKAMPPRGGLGAEALARAFAGTGRAADAQAAVMVAPWEKVGWMALGDALEGR